jgi:hypothetical protein
VSGQTLKGIAPSAVDEAARRPSVRLKRGGSASHLKAVVQHDLGKRNGLFLESVARSGRLDMNAPAGAHVTPENVKAYVSLSWSGSSTRKDGPAQNGIGSSPPTS